MSFRFTKSVKLKSRKTIELLFEKGKTVTSFPVKVYFITIKNDETTQAAFSVPKRNFKKAVDRNRIKRKLREAYRLQKHLLNTDNGSKFVLLFLYLSKDKLQYTVIEKAIKDLFKNMKT